MMKAEILKIAEALKADAITKHQAKVLLLDLFQIEENRSEMPSFPDDNNFNMFQHWKDVTGEDNHGSFIKHFKS